jgi:hypothetical protein
MQSKAKTASEYIKSLPADRQVAIKAVRGTILKNLPKGYEETMAYGMITYVVPLKLYPAGYGENKNVPLPYLSLASQKNHMALYMMCIYGEGEDRFKKDYLATGKKLDMGKGCVRFKKLEDLPLAMIGKTVARFPVKKFVDIYKQARAKR